MPRLLQIQTLKPWMQVHWAMLDAGLPDWFAQTNTNAVGDCGTETGNIPINDDVRVVDLNGNKAIAFYANGKRCNNNNGSVVNNAAILGQKLMNLVVGQAYDVSLDASYDGAAFNRWYKLSN